MPELQGRSDHAGIVDRALSQPSAFHFPSFSLGGSASARAAGGGIRGGGRRTGQILGNARCVVSQSIASEGRGFIPLRERAGAGHGALRSRDGRPYLLAKSARTRRRRPVEPYPGDTDFFHQRHCAGHFFRHESLARRGRGGGNAPAQVTPQIKRAPLRGARMGKSINEGAQLQSSPPPPPIPPPPSSQEPGSLAPKSAPPMSLLLGSEASAGGMTPPPAAC